MTFDIKKVLENLENDLSERLASAERKLDEQKNEDRAEIDDPEVRIFAERLRYAVMAAQAHRDGVMPWRAGYKAEEDFEWCTQVAKAVREKRARPEHPNSDIEQALLNAFGT